MSNAENHEQSRPAIEESSESHDRERNLYGQSMGRKGAETRERLIKATVDLLGSRSIRDVSVAEIAAAAGTSSSGFYIYFSDVSDAALAAARRIEQITPEIEALLTRPWYHSNSLANAQALIKAYVMFASRHEAILRVRNLAADEGDARFDEARDKAVERIKTLLATRIAAARSTLEPNAGASAVLALMERIAAISRLPIRRHHSRKSLIAAAGFIVANALASQERRADGSSFGSDDASGPLK